MTPMTPTDEHGIETFLATWAGLSTIAFGAALIRCWYLEARAERAENRAQNWEDHARKLARRTSTRDYID